MTPAHASVGAAATWPTSGTIFSPADATRHGAAASPQPAVDAHNATINIHFMTPSFPGCAARERIGRKPPNTIAATAAASRGRRAPPRHAQARDARHTRNNFV